MNWYTVLLFAYTLISVSNLFFVLVSHVSCRWSDAVFNRSFGQYMLCLAFVPLWPVWTGLGAIKCTHDCCK